MSWADNIGGFAPFLLFQLKSFFLLYFLGNNSGELLSYANILLDVPGIDIRFGRGNLLSSSTMITESNLNRSSNLRLNINRIFEICAKKMMVNSRLIFEIISKIINLETTEKIQKFKLNTLFMERVLFEFKDENLILRELEKFYTITIQFCKKNKILKNCENLIFKKCLDIMLSKMKIFLTRIREIWEQNLIGERTINKKFMIFMKKIQQKINRCIKIHNGQLKMLKILFSHMREIDRDILVLVTKLNFASNNPECQNNFFVEQFMQILLKLNAITDMILEF